MKRRNFLQYAASSLILPVLIDGYGGKAYARPSSFIRSLIDLAAPTDRILVIIQLQGGNDGLNTVIPLDQMSTYTSASFRGNIALPEAQVLKSIDGPASSYDGYAAAVQRWPIEYRAGRFVPNAKLFSLPGQRHLDDGGRLDADRSQRLGGTLPGPAVS